MKKIILSTMAFIGIISLTSCRSNEESYDLDDAARTSEIGTAWLDEVFKISVNASGEETSSTYELINVTESAEYDESKTAHYELFLPKSEYINDSIRSNYSSLSSVSSKSQLYLNYASTTNFSESDYTFFAETLNKDENKAKFEAITSVTGLTPQSEPSKRLELTKEYLELEASTRVLTTIYVPMHVKYYKYRSDGTKTMTLYTFVLVPTYYSLTTRTSTTSGDSVIYTYNDATSEAMKEKEIKFTVSNGAIK